MALADILNLSKDREKIKENNINKYLRIALIILFFMIIASTLLVKQHVVVDVISGFIISSFVYFIVCKTKIWTFLKLKDL